MYNEIPLSRPDTPVLDSVEYPADFRHFSLTELNRLADELRHFLLYTVGKTGGHFSAGLGTVELTVALHYVFNTPDDKLVWDVGHQAYPHKILTGRRQQMGSLRSTGGIAPFPDRGESPYDSFGVGHASTSIGAALGMAIARHLKGQDHRIVAIIGDGAMTAGQAFEAINHLAYCQEDVLVILNDNAMSISNNVGGMARYFSSISKGHRSLSAEISPTDSSNLAPQRSDIRVGGLFEDLGLKYYGPLDGHNLSDLVAQLTQLKDQKGPRLLHLITRKGKGYGPAEASPDTLHSLTKIEANINQTPSDRINVSGRSYSSLFGQWICDMAEVDPDLIAITPAMREGSDLVDFSERYPHRYIDVAIAEQHAITLAAGLACGGAKPVVAIYSTFLQRGFDQLLHDVAIQNLDILFAVDRAGLLEDGATHSGIFDIAFLRCIPNMILMAPSDEAEARRLFCTGYYYKGPAAVRYPRGKGPGIQADVELLGTKIGKSRQIREGRKFAILSFGALLTTARLVAEKLDASLLDMRFIKPLDTDAIDDASHGHDFLVTLEEHVIMGGAGSAVNEYLAKTKNGIPLLNLGIPDSFVGHGMPEIMLASCGLDVDGIIKAITAFESTGNQ